MMDIELRDRIKMSLNDKPYAGLTPEQSEALLQARLEDPEYVDALLRAKLAEKAQDYVDLILDELYERHPEEVKQWVYSKFPHGYGLFD